MDIKKYFLKEQVSNFSLKPLIKCRSFRCVHVHVYSRVSPQGRSACISKYTKWLTGTWHCILTGISRYKFQLAGKLFLLCICKFVHWDHKNPFWKVFWSYRPAQMRVSLDRHLRLACVVMCRHIFKKNPGQLMLS